MSLNEIRIAQKKGEIIEEKRRLPERPKLAR
jgi:hypothetical protein